MRIDIFVICDAATESGGKFNILGAFDTIYTRKVPATHPAFAIALRLRLSREEAGEHNFSINVKDPEGNSAIPTLEGKINVSFAGIDVSTATASVILNVQNFKIEKAGEFSVDLAIGGQRMASIPLYVKTKK